MSLHLRLVLAILLTHARSSLGNTTLSARGRICVLTSDSFSSCLAPLEQLVRANKLEYAARHFFELRWVTFLAPRKDGCSYYFNKLDALVHAMDGGCNYLLWLDIDLLVTRMDFNFVDWLVDDRGESIDACFPGGLPSSAPRYSLVGTLNSGVIALRSNARTRAALTSINATAFCNVQQAEQNALMWKIRETDVRHDWLVHVMANDRAGNSAATVSQTLPLMHGECGSSRPVARDIKPGAEVPWTHVRQDPAGAGRWIMCKWQPGDFSAHFYPSACPLHDMLAFLRNATKEVRWPHTERTWHVHRAAAHHSLLAPSTDG